MVNKRRGREDKLVRNDSVKCGLRSKDDHCFDTQRKIAIDFAGNLESISMMRSMGSVFVFSPTFVEVDNCCVLRRTSLRRSTVLFMTSLIVEVLLSSKNKVFTW